MAGIFAKASGKPLPTNPDGKKKYKPPVDPNFPKKPESAYLAFSRDYRKVLKNTEPDLAPKDVMTKAAAAWKEADEDIRVKYNKEAAEHMNQYKEEVTKYKAEKEKERNGTAEENAGPSVSSDEGEEEEPPASSQSKKKKAKAAVEATDESNRGLEKSKKKSRKSSKHGGNDTTKPLKKVKKSS